MVIGKNNVLKRPRPAYIAVDRTTLPVNVIELAVIFCLYSYENLRNSVDAPIKQCPKTDAPPRTVQ